MRERNDELCSNDWLDGCVKENCENMKRVIIFSDMTRAPYRTITPSHDFVAKRSSTPLVVLGEQNLGI